MPKEGRKTLITGFDRPVGRGSPKLHCSQPIQFTYGLGGGTPLGPRFVHAISGLVILGELLLIRGGISESVRVRYRDVTLLRSLCCYVSIPRLCVCVAMKYDY